MPDPRVEAVADILTRYSTKIQPGQLVRIFGRPAASPLLLALYRRILERGAHPWLQLELEEAEELFLTYASEAQLDYLSPIQQEIIEQVDVSIHLLCDSNTKRLSHIDPVRQARHKKATRPILERFLERTAAKELSWVGTLFPTAAFAQDAEMSLRDYENFVYGACLLGEPDPVAAWEAVSQRQQKLIDWLTPHEQIHLTGPDTDLTLSVKGRPWINCDGHENFPDGEIFTSPVEDSVEGTIRYSFPACLYGREVEDVRLWFEKGRVVKARAAKNEDFLLKMIDTDEGARYVGEFAFGTNPGIQRFTKNTLFDEKIGGTIHLALGLAFPEAGGSNRSAIHWDMVCDLRQSGTVTVDGTPFAQNGAFLIKELTD